MNVVEYPGLNAQEVPRMLRTIADQIEAGDLRWPSQMVCVHYVEGPQESAVQLFVLGGDMRPAMMVGILELAKAEVMG